jgi:hypothetical protein
MFGVDGVKNSYKVYSYREVRSEDYKTIKWKHPVV